jgi:hypoxanthine phosphoribosyltransferase
MEYIYTEKDLDIISWERIDGFIDKIYNDVKNYIDENNLTIKYVSPILRGGAVPAVKLSHMFNVVDMLPIQLKHNAETGGVDLKVSLDYLKNPTINGNECILLVEGNHVTGTTANIAVNLLREKFGDNVKIIYVSLTRDYTNRYSVKNTCFTTWAMTTNETKDVSKEDCEKLGIKYDLVSVYPWENVKEELRELNTYQE